MLTVRLIPGLIDQWGVYDSAVRVAIVMMQEPVVAVVRASQTFSPEELVRITGMIRRASPPRGSLKNGLLKPLKGGIL